MQSWRTCVTSSKISFSRCPKIVEHYSSSLWAGHVCTRKRIMAETIVSVIMRFWFVRDIWRYTNVFWLIDRPTHSLIHSLTYSVNRRLQFASHSSRSCRIDALRWDVLSAAIRRVSSMFHISMQQIDASATTTLYNSTKTALYSCTL